MLKKPFRLTQSARFLEIRRSGRSFAGYLMVLTALSNQLSNVRFGFIVSRRVGGAVVRNRARRLMREAVRLRLELIVPGYDVVLVARQPLRQAGFAEVDRELTKLLGRAGLLASTLGAGEITSHQGSGSRKS